MPKKKKSQVKEDQNENNPASEKKPGDSDVTADKFPIIGIGASAGGLEAIEAFLSGTQADSGIAFVIVSHTDPDRATMLPDILSKKSPVEVVLIDDGMEPKPDRVYLPPSDKDLIIENRVFHLKKRTRNDGLHMPIDRFFSSLAADSGSRAGCVILSGTGTDGTQGLRMIKEKAGVTAAQKPGSARHTGMPRSAMDTGLVDFVMTPEKLAERLAGYFENTIRIESGDREQGDRSRELQKIINFLANRNHHDFSLYKKSTLIRRIERRMSVTGCDSGTDYINYLYRNPREADSLFDDLLIGVTNFFRNPEAFVFLKEEVLPGLIGTGKSENPLRIWVAGCSTGEEAYSVAMITQEALEAVGSRRKMHIFATDLDRKAVDRARHGLYIKNIASDVSADRLERFFVEEQNAYRVKGDIREPIVFAVQNLLSDPPYSGIDLLVCRNLLIYLEATAQHKLIPLFHYVLRENGILFMGSSESIGRFGELFEPVQKKHNIYRKKNVREGTRPQVEFPTGTPRLEEGNVHSGEYRSGTNGRDIAAETQKVLLRQYTPACIVVDSEGKIIHIHGRTGMYLEDPEGKPTTRLVDKAREGIRFALSSALRQAGAGNEEVRKEGLRVMTNGDSNRINLTVRPFPGEGGAKNTLMVIFEDLGKTGKEGPDDTGKNESREANDRVIELDQEIKRLRHEYQASLEELQSTNEELRSANEETRSSNEELQSTNEELESSREELQSLNEELTTVNAELNSKTIDLSESYDSITNVLDSTQIAILFLNEELLVKRFTREAARLFNLIDTDVGRPISQLSHNLEYENLGDRMRGVLDDLTPFEDEVKTSDGHWYRMRIMIFRTKEHIIEGTVATFINIDAEKKAILDLERDEKRFEALVKAGSEVLYSMSPDWKQMRHLNSRHFLAENPEPGSWMEKYIPDDEKERVMEAIDKAVEKKEIFELEHGVFLKNGARGRTFSRAVPIMDEAGEVMEWVGAAIDVTEK